MLRILCNKIKIAKPNEISAPDIAKLKITNVTPKISSNNIDEIKKFKFTK